MMVKEDMEHQQCCSCGIHWMMPTFLGNERRKDKGTFYCPNGHGHSYEESEADELRRERDRLQQRPAEKDDDLKELESRRRAAVGQVTKLRDRVGNGVCPCCARSFTNLRRHMDTQHPAWKAEAAE